MRINFIAQKLQIPSLLPLYEYMNFQHHSLMALPSGRFV
jgi:hypothetical protein